MAEITAFVGHSFTQEDAEVVQAFLDYFDQVRSVVPIFSWTHATLSEPVDLQVKVLKAIENANTLIAICTRKERVASPSEYKPVFFAKGMEQVATDKLEWKTSDWVIQEIGLGIGRGMAILILLEEGVRAPGGLQGNIEYLPFNRDHPQKIFGKLLEMINALTPQSAPAGTASPDDVGTDHKDDVGTDHKQVAVTITQSEPETHTAVPAPDWGIEDYKKAAIDALLWDEVPHAEIISEKFLETDLAADPSARTDWMATFEWWKIIFTQVGSLTRLKNLTTESPTNVMALRYYGAALVRYGEQAEGAEYLVRAADLSSNPQETVSFYCEAANALAKERDFVAAEKILDKVRELKPENPDAKNSILTTLRNISEMQASSGAKLTALEGLVELAPSDEDLRFKLAYEHSLAGNRDMALYHYLRIPPRERSSMAWNNLGVSYQEFDMPRMSVSAYRKAAKEGETIAMSNLANRLMKVGFSEEAEKQLNEAIALPDFHKNVALSLAELRSQEEAEEKLQTDLLKAVSEKAAFYRSSGRALLDPNAAPLGRWTSPVCDLEVLTDGTIFTATGTYETKTNALMIGTTSGTVSSYNILYTGRISGRTVVGDVKRTRTVPPPAPSLMSTSSPEKFCAVVSADGLTISVMERVEARNPTIYDLRKANLLPAA